MIQIGCILVVVVGMAVLCPWLQKRVSARWMRRLLWCMSAVYCAGNLYFTLLSRTPGTQSNVSLIPFATYFRMFEVQEETAEAAAGFAAWFLKDTGPVTGIVLNVLLYVPLGYLALSLFPGLKPWQAIVIGLGCSVATELAQWLFKMGWCEVDDVMHNTLGAALGVWAWRWQKRRDGEKMQT